MLAEPSGRRSALRCSYDSSVQGGPEKNSQSWSIVALGPVEHNMSPTMVEKAEKVNMILFPSND